MIHWRLLSPTSSDRPIEGRATLTIETSRTVIKNAVQTSPRTSHRRRSGAVVLGRISLLRDISRLLRLVSASTRRCRRVEAGRVSGAGRDTRRKFGAGNVHGSTITT
jgi:hypothetical protein